LSVVCLSLFAIRFGVTRTLSLRASLVRMALDELLPSSIETATGPKRKDGARQPNDPKNPTGKDADPWQPQPSDEAMAPDGVLRTVDEPEVNNPDSGSEAKKASNSSSREPSRESEPLAKGDRPEEGDDSAKEAASANGSPDEKSPSPDSQPAAGPNGKNASEKSSMLDKMRDAMANLLAKMSMQPKSGDASKAGSSGQRDQKDASQKGPSSPGKPQPGNPNEEAQADREGQKSDSTQAARGKSGDKNSDQPASPDAKSGIGRQDGSKDAKIAEELAAMGKISEIIGKRSASVTGEMMVEVASGKQQLKTQYSGKHGAHAEAGGEINRDEVPLAYQQYVQQYFEEIRKLPSGNPREKGAKISQ
jgi:hypothetical protein